MTEQEAQTFVERFAAAWAARDGAQFLALWHPEGQLHYPFANRVLKGSEIGMLNDLQNRQRAPSHLDAGRLDVARECARDRMGKLESLWRSYVALARVDKLTVVDGRIVEEIVYADTAPLQAMRQGRSFDALIQLPG